MKVPTQLSIFTEQGSSFHLARYSTCAYYGLQGIEIEIDVSTHFESREMFQSNIRLLRRLVCLSYIDGSNQMFLSFKNCPG